VKKLFYVVLTLALAGLLFAGAKAPQSPFGDVAKKPVASTVKQFNRFPSVATSNGPREALPPVGRRPGSLDEVIISQDFEAVADEALPAGWTQIDQDGGTSGVTGSASIWEVLTLNPGFAHSGDKVMLDTYNSPAIANNDWVILPQQTLTGTIHLSYWAAAANSAYPESYEVKVSTTTAQPAAFTNMIESVTNLSSTTWAQHTLDLSTYAGQPFYIGFHYNANDKVAILIDDVLLETVTFGGVEGTITAADGGAPLANVVVSIPSMNLSDTTNASGAYLLPLVQTGARDLVFYLPGYATQTVATTVVANDTVTANAAMVAGPFVNESFEVWNNGTLPPYWSQTSVDAGTTPSLGGGPSTWRVWSQAGLSAHGGDKFAGCSYNNGAVPNDDWLILPQANLTGEISLSYWIASQDPVYPDAYEVRVSTTGNAPANFTNVVYSEAVVSADWTIHVHDLSAYAGAPFWVAFRYNAIDEYILKLDDVRLGPPGSHIAGTVTDGSVPIPGVKVELLTTAFQGVTDVNGQYMFPFIDPSTYSVRFTHPFYDTLTVQDVVVTQGQTTTQDAALDMRAGYYVAMGPVDILDNTMASLSQDIMDTTLISDLDVIVNITHTYDGDLVLRLHGPAGQIVTLASLVGAGGDNFTSTVFDDEASVSITAVAATPPYTGHFRPQQPLTALDNIHLDGTWTLTVTDTATGDEGTLDSWALVVTGGGSAVDQPTSLVPNSFAFRGNYPNPFNPSTTFEFSLERAANASLVIFNITGQEVARVLDNAPLTAGLHTVNFDGSHMTSGVYFARLTAGNHTATRKIALLK
jgi:subtilisin-like proprotein convertase family protein